MPVFDTIGGIRNGKKHETTANTRKSANDIAETNRKMSAHECNRDTESKKRILTQEEVDKHVKIYIGPLIRQLEDLTRFIQEVSTAYRANLFPRVGTSYSSSSFGLSPDRQNVDLSLEDCVNLLELS